ncbi:5348_t:CDS:2 [Cetraspora pellucida]|uniref:5348_t:CDS:1 n=1 Tax=Cetraspora pellucida TaxID=1433469 RepID=A0A9N8VMK2_9GLOM|nr:5348_t:CDS:2 [Cetraspora pellucida]
MNETQFHTVTIAGATGNLGFHITNAFLKQGCYNVNVLRKKPENNNEKADLLASKGAKIVYANYDDKNDLIKAIKGTDVIVSAINGDYYNNQIMLLTAAQEAGVKRFIPSEFGSELPQGLEPHPVIASKYKLREALETSGLEYTYIFNGIFYEFLKTFGFDAKNKKATFYVNDDAKIRIISLADAGRYIAESLKIPEARNGIIRVGLTLTLNELLQKFEEVSGCKWEVIEDKDVQHRFKNKIEPIPPLIDDFKAFISNNAVHHDVDNDKFSFTPLSITEFLNSSIKC